MKEKVSVYGEALYKTHKVGSMVSWKLLNKPKEYGIILKTYRRTLGNGVRFFAYAEVQMANGGIGEFMLELLQVESEVKQCLSNQEKSSS